MGKAEQLMQRLGHMTSKATIDLINSGVQNCPISATVVRNKDAAKGVSVAGLIGKNDEEKVRVSGICVGSPCHASTTNLER